MTEALLSENAAVARVCNVLACEFAQPLSGLVAYAEMLLADSASAPEEQRRDLEGVREGVLRLQRLLECLRATLHQAPERDAGRRIADDVERALAPARLRR